MQFLIRLLALQAMFIFVFSNVALGKLPFTPENAFYKSALGTFYRERTNFSAHAPVVMIVDVGPNEEVLTGSMHKKHRWFTVDPKIVLEVLNKALPRYNEKFCENASGLNVKIITSAQAAADKRKVLKRPLLEVQFHLARKNGTGKFDRPVEHRHKRYSRSTKGCNVVRGLKPLFYDASGKLVDRLGRKEALTEAEYNRRQVEAAERRKQAKAAGLAAKARKHETDPKAIFSSATVISTGCAPDKRVVVGEPRLSGAIFQISGVRATFPDLREELRTHTLRFPCTDFFFVKGSEPSPEFLFYVNVKNYQGTIGAALKSGGVLSASGPVTASRDFLRGLRSASEFARNNFTDRKEEILLTNGKLRPRFAYFNCSSLDLCKRQLAMGLARHGWLVEKFRKKKWSIERTLDAAMHSNEFQFPTWPVGHAKPRDDIFRQSVVQVVVLSRVPNPRAFQLK